MVPAAMWAEPGGVALLPAAMNGVGRLRRPAGTGRRHVSAALPDRLAAPPPAVPADGVWRVVSFDLGLPSSGQGSRRAGITPGREPTGRNGQGRGAAAGEPENRASPDYSRTRKQPRIAERGGNTVPLGGTYVSAGHSISCEHTVPPGE